MQIVKYAFQQHGDERGMLVALEEYNDIPFEIKRVYYMYDTKEGVTRGYHAHKSLEQILICIHGSCKIRLDNGREKKIVSLEKPYEGLYVPNNMWREMYDFSPEGSYLCVAGWDISFPDSHVCSALQLFRCASKAGREAGKAFERGVLGRLCGVCFS